MKRLALLILAAGAFASMAFASAIDITLHSSGDPFINLSTILNQWGTPGTNGTTFTIPGVGTDEFGALDEKLGWGYAPALTAGRVPSRGRTETDERAGMPKRQPKQICQRCDSCRRLI